MELAHGHVLMRIVHDLEYNVQGRPVVAGDRGALTLFAVPSRLRNGRTNRRMGAIEKCRS